MNKLKNILIVLFSVCAIAATVCLCAACGDNTTDYPDYRPTTSAIPEDTYYNGRYIISVRSIGGLPMSNVRVSLENANDEEVAVGISSNGLVILTIEAGIYEVKVDQDSLSAGYYAPTTAIFTDTVNARVNVVITTTVIEETKTANTTYAIGDVMYDFEITDAETQENLKLSSLLATDANGNINYKAIVLNFFYIGCNPCRLEFPAMQQAYTQYSTDVKIISLTPYDTQDDVKDFKTTADNILRDPITFNMSRDTAGLVDYFAVSSYPTTVVIDRYGVVCYRDTGNITSASVWVSMFDYYTSSTYTQQSTSSGDTEDPDNPDTPDIVRDLPTEVMPASGVISRAVATSNFAAEYSADEDEYSWPYLVGEISGLSYIYPANSDRKADGNKIHNSYAILYATVQLDVGDMVSFDYWIDVEDGLDYLHVLINGDLTESYTGDTDGWVSTGNFFVATRSGTYQFAFAYVKDAADPDDTVDDIVRIRNLNRVNASNVVEATDVLTAAVSGSATSPVVTNLRAPAADDEKGYFYAVDGNGKERLLMVDFLHYSTWAAWRNMTNQSSTLGISVSSVYTLIGTNYRQETTTNGVETVNYIVNGNDHTSTVVDAYYMQLFSETGYIPVNNAMKALLDDFAAAYAMDFGTVPYTSTQWLEFCFYFTHYGSEHESNEECWESYDPVRGTQWYNAPEVDITGFYDEDGDIIVTKEDDASTVIQHTQILSQTQVNAGSRYTFTPTTSGVYLIKTYLENTETGMGPLVGVFDYRETVDYISTYAPLNYDYFGLGSIDTDGDGILETTTRYNGQVWLYYYFEAGTSYTLRLGFFTAGTMGEYDFGMQYLGLEYDALFHASGLGDGTWSDELNYTAIPVNYDIGTGYYYHDDNGENGSLIYLDFVHATYMDDDRNKSLYGIIQSGAFNFADRNQGDYTSYIMDYYYRSIEGKNVNDPLYGLIAVDAELLELLDIFFMNRLGSDYGRATGFWLSGCAYYQHFGPSNT